MIVVDAECMECEKPIKWLSGTPRVCPSCWEKIKKGEIK
jgi:hypothetical protein